MLQIEELKVEVGGKAILNSVNMEILEGETHILDYITADRARSSITEFCAVQEMQERF